MRSTIQRAIVFAAAGLLAGCATDINRYGVQPNSSAEAAALRQQYSADNPAVPASGTGSTTDRDPYIRQQQTGFASPGAASGASAGPTGVTAGGTVSGGGSTPGAGNTSGATGGYISGGGTGVDNNVYNNGVVGNAVIIPNNNGQVPSSTNDRSVRQHNGVTGSAPPAADRGSTFSGASNAVAPAAQGGTNNQPGDAAGAMRDNIRNNTPGPNNSVDPNTNSQLNRPPNNSTGQTGTTGGTAGNGGAAAGTGAAQGGSSGGTVGSGAPQGGSSGGTVGSSAPQGGSSGGNAGTGAANGGTGGNSGGNSGTTSGTSGGGARGGSGGGR